MESRFACFYLTRQLEWILRKFQLAEVVLVVSKPHVFNLTGQLVLKPLECSTLAATDQGTQHCIVSFLMKTSCAEVVHVLHEAHFSYLTVGMVQA